MADEILKEVKVNQEVQVDPEVKTALMLVLKKITKLSKEEFIEAELHASATHLLKNPGKLVRPALVFTSAKILGREPQEYVDLATAIELLHTSSLVHDDILDKDTERRNVNAVHMKFGTEKAIIAGDALIAKAIELSSGYGKAAITRTSKAAMDMCAGELLDYNQQVTKAPLDINLYLRIAQLKTASLIAVSTSVVADHTSHELREKLYNAGLNMGFAGQIRDDIMNYLGISDKSKKSVNTDVEFSRPNVVSVFIGHGKPDPLKTAVKLNNFYVDSARLILSEIPGAEMMNSYLDFLEVKA